MKCIENRDEKGINSVFSNVHMYVTFLLKEVNIFFLLKFGMGKEIHKNMQECFTLYLFYERKTSL